MSNAPTGKNVREQIELSPEVVAVLLPDVVRHAYKKIIKKFKKYKKKNQIIQSY